LFKSDIVKLKSDNHQARRHPTDVFDDKEGTETDGTKLSYTRIA
jgi:hypothetical protein